MRAGAKLTLEADVDGDGATETGEFVLDNGIEISPQIRTGDLVGGAFSSAAGIVDKIPGLDTGPGGRAGFNLDAGGGAAVVEIQFLSFEGSSGQWGDGSASDEADATGDSPFRQLSVLYRYLNRGTFDSASPATLEWGEYSPTGVYAPMDVTPEQPSLSHRVTEEASTITGQLTLVSTRAIADLVGASDQQTTK